MKLLHRAVQNNYFRHSFVMAAAYATAAALGFLFWMIAANRFSPEVVGEGQFIISAMTAISAVSLLGFNVSLMHYFPREQGKMNLFSTCLLTSLGIAFCLSVLFLLFLPHLGDFPRMTGIDFSILFIFSTLMWTMGIMLETAYTAMQQTVHVLGRNVLLGFGKIIGLFWWQGSSVLFVSWGLSAALTNAASGIREIFRGRAKAFRVEWSYSTLKKIGRLSLSDYVAWSFPFVSLFILLSLINYFGTPYDAGLFSIPWSVANILFMISFTVTQVFIGEASRSQTDFKLLLKYALMFSSVIWAGSVLLGLFSVPILLLFGETYALASDLFSILLASVIPVSVINIFVIIQNLRNKSTSLFLFNAFRLFILVFAAGLLIPSLGIIGAGWAWLISNLAVVPFAIYRMRTLTQKNLRSEAAV